MGYLNPDYLVYSFSHSCHLSLCRQLAHHAAGFLQSHSKGVFVNSIFILYKREKSSKQLPGSCPEKEPPREGQDLRYNHPKGARAGCCRCHLPWSSSLLLLGVQQTSAFVSQKDKHEVIFLFIINTFQYNCLSCQL